MIDVVSPLSDEECTCPHTDDDRECLYNLEEAAKWLLELIENNEIDGKILYRDFHNAINAFRKVSF